MGIVYYAFFSYLCIGNAEKPFAEKPFAEKPFAEKPFAEKPFIISTFSQ